MGLVEEMVSGAETRSEETVAFFIFQNCHKNVLSKKKKHKF